MQHTERGFTLIELLIVTAVIVIIALISVPNLLASRIAANESAAIQTLRSIVTAQAQCQVAHSIDDNNDGSGEFGFLGELSGVIPVRAGGGIGSERANPGFLSTGFGDVRSGCVQRAGYMFQLFLPDATGGFVPEAATGGAVAATVDATRAQVMWCCYAWPATRETTGRRAFFVDQRGDVLSCTNSSARYGGTTSMPVAGTTAFLVAGSAMTAQLAANTLGADGEHWIAVN